MSTSDNPAAMFSEGWLTLREPVDHAARNAELTARLVQWSKQKSELHIIELGAGTGSNLRYLLPQLGHNQHWQLIDFDIELLAQLPRLLKPWVDKLHAQLVVIEEQLHIKHELFSAIIEWRVVDLSHGLSELPCNNTDLLLSSALLDLTSAHWLDELATLCVDTDCACLFSLNYDGQIKWNPALKYDDEITNLLNEHQLSDKGFGKALGPMAGKYFANRMMQLGREVLTEASLWDISNKSVPASEQLQRAIIDGWALAAMEQRFTDKATIEKWQSERLQLIERGESQLEVSHLDVLSLN